MYRIESCRVVQVGVDSEGVEQVVLHGFMTGIVPAEVLRNAIADDELALPGSAQMKRWMERESSLDADYLDAMYIPYIAAWWSQVRDLPPVQFA